MVADRISDSPRPVVRRQLLLQTQHVGIPLHHRDNAALRELEHVAKKLCKSAKITRSHLLLRHATSILLRSLNAFTLFKLDELGT
ncbi:hypothetical protein BJB45_05420 [Halomonas huangheensis]|uniref:Uncharacterized protein n=1 Tax=Halomonas huangheensis TaxID=1178482 RepID=W1N4W5_9GAMM|nr:hypothetical protein AR456_06790 [Halomonas huangheensis]ERL50568.1 hypothetical protein BJB45_05420 [Halomonas huangheensis]